MAESNPTGQVSGVVLAAAVEIAEGALTDADPAQLLSLVQAVVDCDVVSWSNMDKAGGTQLRGACTLEDDGADAGAAAVFGHQHPVCNGTAPMPALASWDDMVPRSQWERTELFNEFYRPVGVRHEIYLDLSHSADVTNVVILTRLSGKDFDRRDRGLLWLLRPHLDAIFRPAAPPRRLTERQRQVLALVREGHTNAQVARFLGIAPATVRVHLEDIFERLGVHNRIGAVAKAAGELDGAR